MNKKDFLPYAKQAVTEEDRREVAEALCGDWVTRGPKVCEFEEAVANYCGARFAVAFSSGTSALHGAVYAAGVGPYDRVMTTPNSFIASIGPAMQRGATPVFIDIEKETGNFNLELLKYTLEVPFTRGKQVVIPVHFAGLAVDMEALSKAFVHPDSLVIEDAAHALGSSYPGGGKVGSCAYSEMTVFSFHPSKTITTGEGGIVTTNDSVYAQKLRQYRNNGIVKPEEDKRPWYYEVEALTGNHHLTEFQAALGLSQLKRLDVYADKRRALVKRYRERLASLESISLFTERQDEDSCFHLMVVQIDFAALGKPREQIMESLHRQGIGTQVHYIPLYRHPFFKRERGDLSAYFPEMEAYYAQALSLPLFSGMDEADVDRVVDALIQASF